MYKGKELKKLKIKTNNERKITGLQIGVLVADGYLQVNKKITKINLTYKGKKTLEILKYFEQEKKIRSIDN